MTFRAVIELGGKTATGIRVPDEVVAALGAGKRPAVVVRRIMPRPGRIGRYGRHS